MEWLVIPLVAAICAAIVAGKKNRSTVGWFFISLLIPVAILILFCLDKLPGEAPEPTALPSKPRRKTRECPYCAEKILVRAKVCKHCGRDVAPLEFDIEAEQDHK